MQRARLAHASGRLARTFRVARGDRLEFRPALQRRVTSSFETLEGRTLNVRKASLPESELAPLYAALALDPNPGGTKKLIA
jgi:hypothetical protein